MLIVSRMFRTLARAISALNSWEGRRAPCGLTGMGALEHCVSLYGALACAICGHPTKQQGASYAGVPALAVTRPLVARFPNLCPRYGR